MEDIITVLKTNGMETCKLSGNTFCRNNYACEFKSTVIWLEKAGSNYLVLRFGWKSYAYDEVRCPVTRSLGLHLYCVVSLRGLRPKHTHPSQV